MKNAVTFLKTAHNEIMMGKFKNAYQNLNLVIVKSNEAFDLTARKDINVDTYFECLKAMKLIVFSTILIYSFNEEKDIFEIYAKVSESSKRLIAIQLEEINEKCIELKKNVKTTILGIKSKEKKEQTQDVLNEILKITYPFISEGNNLTDSVRTANHDNPKLLVKCLRKYIPQKKRNKTIVVIGRLKTSEERISVWKDEKCIFIERNETAEKYLELDFEQETTEIALTVYFSLIPKTCNYGHSMYLHEDLDSETMAWRCHHTPYCVGGHGLEFNLYPDVEVWRCSNHKRRGLGGSCYFDICGECIKAPEIEPETEKTCEMGHQLYNIPDKIRQLKKSKWRCNNLPHCITILQYSDIDVWRCSHDKRMSRNGSCEFNMCGDCVETPSWPSSFWSQNTEHRMEKKCQNGHQLYLVSGNTLKILQENGSRWICNHKPFCVGGHGFEFGVHIDVKVWRCSNDQRMIIGGTCHFDLCEDCICTPEIKLETYETCDYGHKLYKVPSKVKQVEKSIWSCNGGCGKRSGGQEEVWRCSNDKRMSFKGTCNFDLCGECVVKINKEGNFSI